MKIAIAVNHSWPCVGGSETVVQQISEGLTKMYGFKCTVFSGTVKEPFSKNDVDYKFCSHNHIDFLKQLQGFDHLLIYSDLFVHFPRIIHDVSKVPRSVSIATVGLNACLKKDNLMRKLKEQKDKLKFIVHTKGYRDQVVLESAGCKTHLIPNGIDRGASSDLVYDGLKTDVYEKYEIPKGKKTLLCVSNFFPDKGQDHLPEILSRLNFDFNIIIISSSESCSINKMLRDKTKKLFKDKNIPAIFIEDVPRAEIMNFYHNSDIFVFPSLVESFGIVPMEAMSCGVPWVSFPVGNMRNFKGGLIADKGVSFNINGVVKPTKETYDQFAENIKTIVNMPLDIDDLGTSGWEQVKEEYSLKEIIPKYKEVICE